jgi:PAS domain S-box-containing protein
MLSTEGYVIQFASSGEETLEAVRFQPPDLILLDGMMPGIDGFQVAARLKRNAATKNIPIVMVTALDDRSAKNLGVGVGVEEYLTKPVDRAEVCARVRTMLRLKMLSDYYDQQIRSPENGAAAPTPAQIERLQHDKATFDAAPVGIVHIDLYNKVVRVNRRLCELMLYSHTEVKALGPGDFLKSEESSAETESIREMAAGKKDRHVVEEKQYRRRDGSPVWTRLNMSALRGPDGKPQLYISVIEDLTDRRPA